MNNDLKVAVDNAERIGVIGSPSSTSDLTLDILGTAVNKRLIGNLGVFKYDQEGVDNYAIGQIIEVEMRNAWTQDATMKGLIRQRGRVDPITERQDTHTAKMTVSSVFEAINDRIEQSILGTVPPTGTPIRLLNSEVMNILFKPSSKQYFYLGDAYGTKIPLPMWFKHFGNGPEGAGEAYHIGIFGKTGSGKSVLAKMILAGYSKHKEITIFVLDPQGEFAKDLKTNPEIKGIYSSLGKTIEVYDVHNLVLTNWELFNKILVNSGFLQRIGIILDTNRWQAARQIERILKNSTDAPDKLLRSIYLRSFFDLVWLKLQDESVLSHIYTDKELRQRVAFSLETLNKDEMYKDWEKIARLFTSEGRVPFTTIWQLVQKLDEKNSIIVINLSKNNVPETLYWSENVKNIVIGQFLDAIMNSAEKKFKDNELLNSLIIIDEAHRLAPREKIENEDLQKVKSTLIDAVRTTRKYGLGWLFISQTLSSLDRDIINQIRIFVFGFGLAYGSERDALWEIIGGQQDSMTLYQRFNDPQSSLNEKHYSFMSYGPISPLSFSGTPLFFNAYKYTKEFTEKNNHVIINNPS